MADPAEQIEQQEELEQPNSEQITPDPKAYTRDDWQADQEKLARSNGWKPFDEFIDGGGDPAKWRDAGAYNTFGEMIGSLRRKEEEFNARLDGVQKLAQAQLNQERTRLIAERDALIEEGGRSKDVKALDNQLDKLNGATQAVQPAADPALERWNAENPWIYEKSEKADDAKDIFAIELAKGRSIPQAIATVDAKMKRLYPSTSQAVQRSIPDSERGKPSGGFKSKPAAITMDSLSESERAIWRSSSSMWGGDEKAFLQSVTDTRKAEGGR